ncbi:hypothetical protein TNCV_619791 [Trichonephila clavipes]|nr:hypothetical protein TNCV_619791 [Trichonephila clavipes]
MADLKDLKGALVFAMKFEAAPASNTKGRSTPYEPSTNPDTRRTRKIDERSMVSPRFNKNELRSIHEEVTIFKIKHRTESIRQVTANENITIPPGLKS